MKRIIVSIAALALVMISQLGGSQVTPPEMTLHALDGLPVRNSDDGRVSRRIEGATVGLNRVEWPAGTVTTPHNHANELIVLLVEGRLRALSGEREFVLEPGEMIVVPSYVEHGYEALEDSVTLEAFGPG